MISPQNLLNMIATEAFEDNAMPEVPSAHPLEEDYCEECHCSIYACDNECTCECHMRDEEDEE